MERTTQQHSVETDEEFLVRVTGNNLDAVNLILTFTRISDLWDNLVDRGRDQMTEGQIRELMWHSLLSVPGNKFYQQHLNSLQPVIVTSIIDWSVANGLEKTKQLEDLVRAHTLRYLPLNIGLMIITLCVGPEKAIEYGAEFWARGQRDTFEQYAKEKGL